MSSSRTRHSYDEIRRRLLAGDFAPGTRLDFQKLAVELGVSTTPVREAISQLASEGLLQLVPRLGAVVPTLSREEVIELYGVREAMECYAAAKAAETISPARLAEVRGFVERMEGIVTKFFGQKKLQLEGQALRDFLAADLAFHMTIIEAAGNHRLTKLAADSHAHARIFAADRLSHDRGLLEEAIHQHRAIYEALARHDGEEARRQIALHIERSLDHTLAAHRGPGGSDRLWRPN
jgi:DNA-binding GntR family transcriptional regulator